MEKDGLTQLCVFYSWNQRGFTSDTPCSVEGQFSWLERNVEEGKKNARWINVYIKGETINGLQCSSDW